MNTTLRHETHTRTSMEEMALTLAEGEHVYGDEITMAAYALIMWPGQDCPWFHPGPLASGIEVHPFISIVEEVR